MTQDENLEDGVSQGEDEKLSINPEALSCVEGTSLFYPCSGDDVAVPVRIFSPFVTDFWFVDKGYFVPGNQDTRHSGLDKSADKQPPVLKDNHDYQLIGKNIDGPPAADVGRRREAGSGREYTDIKPCILTESYRHIPSGRTVNIHRRRGFGFSTLRGNLIASSLGVFFYRGDSPGEGGSGDLWLIREHLDEVCNKLVNGGLIVTDGSNHGRSDHTEHEELWNHRNASGSVEEIMKSAQQFTDRGGRSFTCVGYAGKRYGHTLIWQVKKG